jgi:hypothetical protein
MSIEQHYKYDIDDVLVVKPEYNNGTSEKVQIVRRTYDIDFTPPNDWSAERIDKHRKLYNCQTDGRDIEVKTEFDLDRYYTRREQA